MGQNTSTTSAQGMTYTDGTAIKISLVSVNAELLLASKILGGEGL